jgi:hypothetical protein
LAEAPFAATVAAGAALAAAFDASLAAAFEASLDAALDAALSLLEELELPEHAGNAAASATMVPTTRSPRMMLGALLSKKADPHLYASGKRGAC